MKNLLCKIALKIWPDFQSLANLDQLALLRELFGILFALPFVFIAAIWLTAETDLALLREQWPFLLLLLGLSVQAGRLSFFQISVGPDGSYTFFGILDPASGRLTYANAGHNPPYLFKAQSHDDALHPATPQGLPRTGIPLGILEETSWETKLIDLEHGDVLILYTDGIPEAQKEAGEFFGEQRLLQVAQENLSAPAQIIEDAVLAAVNRFSSAGAHCDDETLVIIKGQ